MTAQRWGILATAGTAFASSIISVLGLAGAIHLTPDLTYSLNLAFVNAAALAGAMLVKSPAQTKP